MEFSPKETKLLNIKEWKNILINENVLSTSSHKIKIENINDINYYYYTTTKNNKIENNTSLKKYNTKSIITLPDSFNENLSSS